LPRIVGKACSNSTCWTWGSFITSSASPPPRSFPRTWGSYKGYVAENSAAVQLRSAGVRELYTWTGKASEIEFLIPTAGGAVPIEIKCRAPCSPRQESIGVPREVRSPHRRQSWCRQLPPGRGRHLSPPLRHRPTSPHPRAHRARDVAVGRKRSNCRPPLAHPEGTTATPVLVHVPPAAPALFTSMLNDGILEPWHSRSGQKNRPSRIRTI
jgi:hypothetical protein